MGKPLAGEHFAMPLIGRTWPTVTGPHIQTAAKSARQLVVRRPLRHRMHWPGLGLVPSFVPPSSRPQSTRPRLPISAIVLVPAQNPGSRGPLEHEPLSLHTLETADGMRLRPPEIDPTSRSGSSVNAEWPSGTGSNVGRRHQNADTTPGQDRIHALIWHGKTNLEVESNGAGAAVVGD